jgi:hypothetical protein
MSGIKAMLVYVNLLFCTLSLSAAQYGANDRCDAIRAKCKMQHEVKYNQCIESSESKMSCQESYQDFSDITDCVMKEGC